MVIPRRGKLRRSDFVDHGYTIGCPGCDSIRQGREKQVLHTEACRARLEAKLAESDAGRSRLQRAQENIERTMSENVARGDDARSRRERPSGEPDAKVPRTEESGQQHDDPMSVPAQGENVLVRPDEEGDIDMSVMAITGGNDLSEIYSPPRITARAARHGLKGGWALDITSNDENGIPWDFDVPPMREKARALVRETKPTLLVWCPMCTWFCALQNLNFPRMDPAVVKAGLQKATRHLEFVCELYREQVRGGRYFLHEHPLTATSWRLPCVQEVMGMPQVMTVVADMCCFGMVARETDGTTGLVKKPTRWLTNCACIAACLSRRCSMDHQHVTLLGGKAKAAAIYPDKLCDEICR